MEVFFPEFESACHLEMEVSGLDVMIPDDRSVDPAHPAVGQPRTALSPYIYPYPRLVPSPSPYLYLAPYPYPALFPDLVLAHHLCLARVPGPDVDGHHHTSLTAVRQAA